MTTRHDVEFDSQGDALRGWWYEPPAPGAGGGGVAHGFSGVKEQSLDEYAEVFASASFGVLAFDHPGLGASDGEPRQEINPQRQLAGYRDAISYAAAQPSIDPGRVAVWGTSMSGGLTIALAATEERIRCAVAQVPFLEVVVDPDAPLPAGLGDPTGDDSPIMVPVTAPEGGMAVLTADRAHEWSESYVGRAPRWRNEVTLASLIHTMGFRPIDCLGEVRVPLLLVGMANDSLTPPGAARAASEANPLIEYVESAGAHFDAYRSVFPFTSEAAAKFFRAHL